MSFRAKIALGSVDLLASTCLKLLFSGVSVVFRQAYFAKFTQIIQGGAPVGVYIGQGSKG